MPIEQGTSRISIVIPVYNGAGYLEKAIESALNQTIPPAEIAITDDASADGTPHIIERYKGHPLVTIQTLPERVIAPVAWNKAIRFSRAPYFVILAHDDLLHPAFVAESEKVLTEHPETEFIVTGYRTIDENGNVTGERPIPRPELIGKTRFDDFFREVVVSAGMYFCDAGSVVSRTAFEVAGGFDERFKGGVYDYDFYLRVAAATHTFGIAACLADYRIHASNMSSDLHRDDKGDADVLFSKLEGFPFSEAQKRQFVRNMSNFEFQHFTRALRAGQLTVGQVHEAREKTADRLKRWANSGNRFAADVLYQPSGKLARLAWTLGATSPGIVLARTLINLLSRKRSKWS